MTDNQDTKAKDQDTQAKDKDKDADEVPKKNRADYKYLTLNAIAHHKGLITLVAGAAVIAAGYCLCHHDNYDSPSPANAAVMSGNAVAMPYGKAPAFATQS